MLFLALLFILISSNCFAQDMTLAQNYGSGASHVGIDYTTASSAAEAITPADWTSSFDSVWNFEDSPGLTADSGTVGETLTNNGGITSTSDSSVQGSKVADLVGGGTNWFSLADGGNTDRSGYGVTISSGCWTLWDADSTSANEYIITKGEAPSIGSGYALYNRGVSGNRIPFRAYLNASTTPTSGGCSNCCDTGTGDCASRPVFYENQIAECTQNNDCYVTDTASWHWVSGVFKSSTDASTSNGLGRVRVDGRSVSSSSSIFQITDNAVTFKIGFNVDANDLDGKIDECFWDDAELTDTESCRICSLGIAGQRGECDPNTQSDYKICNNNSDCVDSLCVMESNTTDEDNCASSAGGTQGCCMGYNYWPRAGLNCNDCDLPACNATRS